MKNVCVLSDNRTGWNWGARATSIALIELIKQHCNICGRVTEYGSSSLVRHLHVQFLLKSIFL